MNSASGPDAPGIKQSSMKVGFWFTEKKRRQMKVEEHFGKQCEIHGLELVKISLDDSLESEGPFCAIVHKISDLMVLGEQGDTQAEEACRNLEAYASRHPETVIIDPLPNVRLLSNRYRMFKATESVNTISETVFTPPFVKLTTNNVEENILKLREKGVKFPLVCKPLPSHGSSHAHQMCLVFGAHGLKDIQAPCVAQSFVCHGAVLYKIFVVGKEYHVVDRPSLKNFQAGEQETIFFNSHDVSKHPTPSSWLTKLDESDVDLQQRTLPPSKSRLDEIVGLLQRKLGLDLFGIDVIVQSGTGNCAVIDVNTFPGYTEVPCLWESVCQLILRRMSSQRSMVDTSSKDCITSCSPNTGLVHNQPKSSVSCCASDLVTENLRAGVPSESTDINVVNAVLDDIKTVSGFDHVLDDCKSSNLAATFQDSAKSPVLVAKDKSEIFGVKNTGKNSRKHVDLEVHNQHKKFNTVMGDVPKNGTDTAGRMNVLKKGRANPEVIHTESRGDKMDALKQIVDEAAVLKKSKGNMGTFDGLKDSREDSGIDTSDSCDEKKSKNAVGEVWKHDPVLMKKKK